MARPVYRDLLRSCSQAFRNDAHMQQNARTEIRGKFQAAAMEQDPGKLKQLFAEGREAADFIRTFVVQAKLNERGNYEMKVEKHHANTEAEEAAIR